MQGTGIESAAQPLSRFAGLTHTLQTLPVADFGAGVKVNLSPHVRLRLEVRDYLSTRPDQVIAPAPAVALKGFLHDVLGLVALGYTFGGGSLTP